MLRHRFDNDLLCNVTRYRKLSLRLGPYVQRASPRGMPKHNKRFAFVKAHCREPRRGLTLEHQPHNTYRLPDLGFGE
jgi:hypothetical protein